MKTKPTFSQNLFWDVDINTFDIDKFPEQTIERVLQYGQWEDWVAVVDYFSMDKIKQVVVNLRNIDDRTLAYLSIITEIPETEFRCYKLSQLNPQHWY